LYSAIERMVKMRRRPQITVEDVVFYLSKLPGDTPVYCAISIVNEDEPIETQEFISDDKKTPCVAIERVNRDNTKYVTFGFK